MKRSAFDAAALRHDRERRQRQGVFYTPDCVANYLAASTLAASSFQSAAALNSLRIVDPACGEGALLWAVYCYLCTQLDAQSPVARLQIIQRQLFGMDLDGKAIERLRQRFRDDLMPQIPASRLEAVLHQNLRCGDAVHGAGWETPGLPVSETDEKLCHWSREFPEVCGAGGFDVVIANPPYRRERGAKTDLDYLSRSPLALAYRQARMDLWHYFFHRSLDLLRPGGVLTFIVNSYWTASHAGRPLVDRLRNETTPLEFLLLESAPVFAGVGGRHLIARIRKGVTDERCRIVHFTQAQQRTVLDPELWQALLIESHAAGHSGHSVIDEVTVPREALFSGNRRQLQFHRARSSSLPPLSEPVSGRRLEEAFEVRQGIAENPPRVTRRQAAAHPELQSGEGVFVLTAEELAALKLSKLECEFVRPYFTAAEMSRFWTVPQPQHWVLYLTRQTAPDLKRLPTLERHLSRFRGLLEQRREALQGKIAWWHLHWPRESRLFEHPRILAVQMSREPRFAYVESPTYVGFSMNVIVEQTPIAPRTSGNPSLEALAAILNSESAAHWFDSHAKHRGINLDITGSALKEFPLPEVDEPTNQALIQIGRQRAALQALPSNVGAAVSTQIDALERQLDTLVASIY